MNIKKTKGLIILALITSFACNNLYKTKNIIDTTFKNISKDLKKSTTLKNYNKKQQIFDNWKGNGINFGKIVLKN